MNEINVKLIKENVKKLFDENRLTQTELAGIINTSQSNLSKLLNPNNNVCFNLNQLYKISQTFNISIDQLVGNSTCNTYNAQQSKYSVRQICSFIATLIKDDYLSYHFTEINENNACECSYDDNGNEYKYDIISKKSNYLTLYFSQYNRFKTLFNTDDERNDEQCLLEYYGNYNSYNQKINSFLSTYIQLYEQYENANLTDKAFEEVVEALIKNIN